MTKGRFLIEFTITSVITAALLIFLYLFPGISGFLDLGFITWALFSVLSVFLFLIADKAVFHPERTRFISVTIANMLIKMVFSIGLVLSYYTLKKPVNGLFILPFLLVYGIFTIFETRFLLQIANQKNKHGKK